MKIEQNLGAVDSFNLPEKWVADPPIDLEIRQTQIYRSPDSTDILLCHHYRSEPLSRAASNKFQDILYAPFHDLSRAEINDLEEVLEGLANESVFQVCQAGTGYLNDRRVIRVRGDWLTERQSVLSYFIDNVGNGSRVENIYFCAPLGQLDALSDIAEEIFSSLKWKRA